MTAPKPNLKDIFDAPLAPEHMRSEDEQEKVPSWFHTAPHDGVAEAFNTRYASQNSDYKPIVETPGPEKYEEFKRRMDDKFAQAQRLYDPEITPAPSLSSALRPTLPLSDIHGRRKLYQEEQRAFIAETEIEKTRPYPIAKMLGLGLFSLMFGGGAGLYVADKANFENTISQSIAAVQGQFSNFTTPVAEKISANTVTVIHKKSITIASLNVADAAGDLNTMIPLSLNATVAQGAEPVDLRVMGLPPTSYLTKGVEVTKGNWLLKPEDVAGVKLVVPEIDAQQFNVEVAAVEQKTGVLAAPVKELTVAIADAKADAGIALPTALAATIAPATAAPEPQSQAAQIPQPAVVNPQTSGLIAKGDDLLNSGDIASARQFYLKANELGDANGAYGVGRTYDPTIYAALHVEGLVADAARAAQWYQKAKLGGVGAARTALETLQATTP
jgi:hypothetical protein